METKQNISFGQLVDCVYELSLNDRLELKDLLEHNIVEERRAEILANVRVAKMEEKQGLLNFSDKISELKKML
jgi:hypothetical protein